MMINIRRADDKDVDLLTTLGAVTFIESHGHSGPIADITSYRTRTFNEDAIRNELNDPKNIYHLIFYKDEPAGFSKIVFDLPYAESDTKNITKLDRLYLLKEFYGLNLGSALFNYLMALMKEKNQAGVWLYTWKQNPRAIKFYQKMGFQIIGSHDFKLSETHSNPNHQMLLRF